MIDFDSTYRPDTYWPESLTPEQRMSRIKGAERQAYAQLIYQEYGFSVLDDFLVRESLPDNEREDWGAIHPAMMGGEYLPDLLPDEVEICRLSLRSVTADQISVRARPDPAGVRYRIVDEYEEMVYVTPYDTSELPLTAWQLLMLIQDTYVRSDPEVGGIFNAILTVQSDHAKNREQILSFIKVSSPLYPELDALYRELGNRWCDEHLAEEEEEGEDL